MPGLRKLGKDEQLFIFIFIFGRNYGNTLEKKYPALLPPINGISLT